ncbi:hypothetical protein [Streptomyces sp. MJP52]|uniref:hypothetical protein n=1 Tax=Streptomyces sp. MJP52 TaxID=2940555 RepID=UPI002473233A|nr:hypothetical protein [Streptomyces sp. MJP52]MDH6229236.1 hypothetical protein [Streptomyces sp. MJP52]
MTLAVMQALLDIFAAEPVLVKTRPGQTLLADKNYYGRKFERQLAEVDVQLLRPARPPQARHRTPSTERH